MRSSILSPPQPIKSKSKSYILTVFQKLLELKQITSLLRFTQRHAHSEVSSHRFVQWHLVHWVLNCVAWPLVWKACGSQQDLSFHRTKINQSTFMLYPFQVKTLLICCGWVRQMRIVHLVIKFDHNGKVIIHTFWRENSILISFTSTQNWWTSCLIERRCKSLVP